ncbi:MAG: ATP-dependent Clp protease proteolytic subunit, partial [Acidimicrobiales bacterium]|nr:ATP-dependent Clp protease proteolytic subunit [Acidimicrobiales bacterium]
ERIVFLGTDVNDNIANQLAAQILYLDGQDSDQDIWLYINSPGGSISAGMAIYDTMQFVTADVGTVCMGLAASMGQFLLCAGAEGKRYALPHSQIMMHQPSGGFQGQASDIAIQAERMLYIKRLMAERIAHHTGQNVEQIEEDSERDRWFTAEQAKDYGIIDSVILRRGELA